MCKNKSRACWRFCYIISKPGTSFPYETMNTRLAHRAMCLSTTQLSLIPIASNDGRTTRRSWDKWRSYIPRIADGRLSKCQPEPTSINLILQVNMLTVLTSCGLGNLNTSYRFSILRKIRTFCIIIFYCICHVCSVVENTLYVTTSALNATTDPLPIALELVYNGSRINVNRAFNFQYHRNPVFDDIRPTTHLTVWVTHELL